MIKNSQRVREVITLLLVIINWKQDLDMRIFSYVSDNDRNFINGETILHAWNWSLKVIENYLEEIRDAGYTAIQISPIQGTKDNSIKNIKWWVLYQPVNFKIGNFQIGTKDELINLCKKAHKLGIKIISDVIVNHTASKGGGEESVYPHDKVDKIIRENPDFWHSRANVIDWNDRWQVTHLGIGLPDLNTENEDLQDIIIDFLNELIECGVDGIRFDAAKHIELPEDPGGSNFWPRVLSSLECESKLILYGEVLQSGASNYVGYSKYMALSAEGYSYWIRSSVGYGSEANLNYINNYCIPELIKPTNLVAWVESHDDYASSHGKTFELSDKQIIAAWAIIASRKDPSVLFFNRPNENSKLSGIIGEKGNDLWKSKEIVAINKFRAAMKGQDEKIINEGKKVAMIQRGNKGLIIINLGEDLKINWQVNLNDSIYIDEITGEKCAVINGKLKMKLKKDTIIILYKQSSEKVDFDKNADKREQIIYFKKPENWENPMIYIYNDDKSETPWPGIEMTSEGNGIYSVVIPQGYETANIIFNDRKHQIPSVGQRGFKLENNNEIVY